jgi:putative transposase
MPHRKVQFVPGAYFHIYHRGNNRQPIFFRPENYDFFLMRMRQYLEPVADVMVYCLMPSHYHLGMRIKENVTDPRMLSNVMMRLLISYSKAINRSFDRVGHLFQGPFQAKPVPDDDYLRQVCCYIHANPVKAGLVFHPEDWVYSNHRAWLHSRFETDAEKRFFKEIFRTPGRYAELMQDYLENRMALQES